jgi:hypothetical protein
MKTKIIASSLFAILPMMPSFAAKALYGDAPDAKHAWGVHDWNRPKPSRVSVNAKGIPSDAVVLFDGSAESFEKNWAYSRKKNPSKWEIKDGAMTVKPAKHGSGVETRAKFGDCQLHIEFRHPAWLASNSSYPQDRGNSGIFLMGNYEVQVLESYNTCEEMKGKDGYIDNYADGQCGAVYAENPPMVNPLKKPGEWQAYDIVFHQPVWENGKLLHPGSITVFLNGVLVQDHWEMEGLTTHRFRRPLAPHDRLAPLKLQYHSCEVSFRNIWIRPLPSRWDNVTHSNLSAKPEKVTELRGKTAAALFAKIKNPSEVSVKNFEALAEVAVYSPQEKYVKLLKNVKSQLEKRKKSGGEEKHFNSIVKYLKKHKVL